MPLEQQRATSSRPRPTEATPTSAPAATHYTPEQVRRQADDTRAQAAYYEQKQAEWSEQHRELQRLKEDKAEFAAQLDELGMKLHNVVRRLAREIDSMEKEKVELRHYYDNLARHLQVLSGLDPSDWSAANMEQHLLSGLAKLDRAENDLNEAYLADKHFQHTRVFDLHPSENKRWGLSWSKLQDELVRGLFFHLPLCILILILFIAWYALS